MSPRPLPFTLFCLLFGEVLACSISCGFHGGTKHCILMNVCYSPAPREVLCDLPANVAGTLLPVEDLSASSVQHSGLLLDVTTVPSGTLDAIKSSSEVVGLQSVLLLRRFLPGNLFHMIHDELLPVFATLNSTGNATVLVLDDGPSVFDDLYALSPGSFEFAQLGKIYCAEKMYVGLSRRSLWYQYGFERVQGPLYGTDAALLRSFRDSVITMARGRVGKMGQKDGDKNDGRKRCLIVIRSRNRKILNLEVVKTETERQLRCVVDVASLPTEISSLIQQVSQVDYLIGMHGAELSLVLFLPRGASLLELFPFAVYPGHYLPYKTLCERIGVKYHAWENLLENLSVGHPQREAHLGGINHLPGKEQLEILSQTKVGRHLCCDNPSWLYRIYQDTIIDIGSFVEKLQRLRMDSLSCGKISIADTLVKETPESDPVQDEPEMWRYLEKGANHRTLISDIYPGPVRDLKCSRTDGTVLVRWRAPFNMNLQETAVLYNVLWQCGQKNGATLTRTQGRIVLVECMSLTYIWVSAEIGERSGRANTYPTVC